MARLGRLQPNRPVVRSPTTSTKYVPPTATALPFWDTFTDTTGTAWNSSKWTTDAGTDGTLDIQSNEGRLGFADVANARARATALMTSSTDQELLMSYRFSSNTAIGRFDVFLRGDGTWGSQAVPTNCYFVEMASDNAGIDLKKCVSDVVSTIQTAASGQAVTTTKQWLRFRVVGTTLKVKVWTDGGAEPSSWDIEATDPDLASGVLQLRWARGTANSGAKDVFVDDIMLDAQGGSRTLLTIDDFNRADGSLGANWNTVTSHTAIPIASNAAVPGTGSDDANRYSAITWPNDQYAQARITVATTGSDVGPGLMLRANTSGTVNLYRIVAAKAGTNNIALGKFVGGTYTNIWTRTAAVVDGDMLRAEAQGTTLRVFINDVQVGADSTDASLTAGQPGIYYSTSAGAATIDNWQAGGFFVTTIPSGVGQAVQRPATQAVSIKSGQGVGQALQRNLTQAVSIKSGQGVGQAVQRVAVQVNSGRKVSIATQSEQRTAVVAAGRKVGVTPNAQSQQRAVTQQATALKVGSGVVQAVQRSATVAVKSLVYVGLATQRVATAALGRKVGTAALLTSQRPATVGAATKVGQGVLLTAQRQTANAAVTKKGQGVGVTGQRTHSFSQPAQPRFGLVAQRQTITSAGRKVGSGVLLTAQRQTAVGAIRKVGQGASLTAQRQDTALAVLKKASGLVLTLMRTQSRTQGQQGVPFVSAMVSVEAGVMAGGMDGAATADALETRVLAGSMD